MTRRKTGMLAVAAILVAAAAGTMALPGKSPDSPAATEAPSAMDPSPPVGVAEVRMSTLAVPVETTGIMSRRVEAALSFHKGGIIGEVLVRTGEQVKRGQILARLRLDEIDAALAQAEIQEQKSKRDVSRYEQLSVGGAVSVESLENARTSLELAEARLKVARFDRHHAELVAPADGAILARRAEPDERVEPGRTILDFGSSEEGWIVKASLAEPDARRLRIGDKAEFEGATGEISHISEAADPVTRTVGIEVKCDEPPEAARSNRVVAMTLTPRPVPERPVVPASALIAGDGGTCRAFFWDKDTGIARSERVEVVNLLGEMAFLKPRAATEWSWVVTRGAEFLRDGMKVRGAVQP